MTLDELIENAKRIKPSFNPDNPGELRQVVEAYILSLKLSGDEFTYKMYLKDIIYRIEEEYSREMLKKEGLKGIQTRLNCLAMEKDIVETKIQATRKFLS